MEEKKQNAKVEIKENANFTELEKPFGYLTTKDENFITCLDVKFKTNLDIEEARKKIKDRDYLIVTLLIESILLLTAKENKQ